MIRSVKTLVVGVMIATLVIVVAVLAAIGVIGLSAKVALFGEPKASLATIVLDRLTNLTRITPNNREAPGGKH